MAEWLGDGLQNHLHRFESGHDLSNAVVAELVYAHDLKSCESNLMWVRLPPAAQIKKTRNYTGLFYVSNTSTLIYLAPNCIASQRVLNQISIL